MVFKAFACAIFALTTLSLSTSQSVARTIQLVGFGDSLMAGYELPPEDAFPAKLEKRLKALGYDVTITNAGVSGDTTADGLARIDWSIPDGTDGVILELGANDALRGVSPVETFENLDKMIKRLEERGIPVLLAGILAPPSMGEDYTKQFNAIYTDLAEKYGLPLYPFFLDGVTLHPDLQLKDGMHPNAEGTAVMAEKILPVMDVFLKSLHP